MNTRQITRNIAAAFAAAAVTITIAQAPDLGLAGRFTGSTGSHSIEAGRYTGSTGIQKGITGGSTPQDTLMAGRNFPTIEHASKGPVAPNNVF